MSSSSKHFIRHYVEMVVAMLAGMLAVMLLRPAEYTHHHGPAPLRVEVQPASA